MLHIGAIWPQPLAGPVRVSRTLRADLSFLIQFTCVYGAGLGLHCRKLCY